MCASQFKGTSNMNKLINPCTPPILWNHQKTISLQREQGSEYVNEYDCKKHAK